MGKRKRHWLEVDLTPAARMFEKGFELGKVFPAPSRGRRAGNKPFPFLLAAYLLSVTFLTYLFGDIHWWTVFAAYALVFPLRTAKLAGRAASLLINLATAGYRRALLARTGLDRLDSLSGQEFEELLALLFERMGYRVEKTPASRDFGADLILVRDGERTVVQAKRYSSPVGVSAIQEAAAARPVYGCSHALVITTSTYTPSARQLARANGVQLWDREKLVRNLLQYLPRPAAAGGREPPLAGDRPPDTLPDPGHGE